jgi:hypothetical protein
MIMCYSRTIPIQNIRLAADIDIVFSNEAEFAVLADPEHRQAGWHGEASPASAHHGDPFSPDRPL